MCFANDMKLINNPYQEHLVWPERLLTINGLINIQCDENDTIFA